MSETENIILLRKYRLKAYTLDHCALLLMFYTTFSEWELQCLDRLVGVSCNMWCWNDRKDTSM